jgi:hypothetical protein
MANWPVQLGTVLTLSAVATAMLLLLAVVFGTGSDPQPAR